MKVGDIVKAKLEPKRTDDLTEAGQALVGQTFRWIATRYLADELSSEYDGQLRMDLWPTEKYIHTKMRWVPECDLADVEMISIDPAMAYEYWLLNEKEDEERNVHCFYCGLDLEIIKGIPSVTWADIESLRTASLFTIAKCPKCQGCTVYVREHNIHEA